MDSNRPVMSATGAPKAGGLRRSWPWPQPITLAILDLSVSAVNGFTM
jgi:hypothetical protein